MNKLKSHFAYDRQKRSGILLLITLILISLGTYFFWPAPTETFLTSDALGMSIEEIDRLHRFRESGKWINSIADFKKVTQVSDSLLTSISPLFKFPDWVTNPKPKSGRSFVVKTTAEKGALNKITIPQLITYEARKTVRAILNDYTVKEIPIVEKIDVNKATASDLSTIKYINFDLGKEIVDYRTLREGIRDIDELLNIEGINQYLFERIKLYIFISEN